MNVKNYLTLLVSLIVLVGLFLFINPKEYYENLLAFNSYFLLILVFLFGTDLFLRVIRWWILLHSQERKLPIVALIYPTFASGLINVILPGRIGELIRLYSLKEKFDVRYSTGLSVIVVEQVINMMSLVFVSSIALGLLIYSGVQLQSEIFTRLLPYAFIGSLIVIIGIALLFIVDPLKFYKLFGFMPEKLKLKIERLLTTFSFGLKTIKGKFLIFWIALGSSVTIWVIEGIMIWIIAVELIHNQFEFPVALFASTLGNLNFLFPILPGAALQYEGFVAFVLSLSSFYNEENAVQVAFTDRIVKTILLFILGGFSLLKMEKSVRDLIFKRNEDKIKEINESKSKLEA